MLWVPASGREASLRWNFAHREPFLDPDLLVRRYTSIAVPPLVPEIMLHLAREITSVWEATGGIATRAPFWAFAWAGGQALARYVLDHPEDVAGRVLLDFGAGSGLVAIAAAKAGAAQVLAADIDPFAEAAITANAELNATAIVVTTAELIDTVAIRWEVVTAGDVYSEQSMTKRVAPWLRTLAARGSLVLLGDPGRAYLPATGLRERARYCVQAGLLGIREARTDVVWEVLAHERAHALVESQP
jgi:predicted nicotinamide N-methyase